MVTVQYLFLRSLIELPYQAVCQLSDHQVCHLRSELLLPIFEPNLNFGQKIRGFVSPQLLHHPHPESEKCLFLW